jgi:hypothetical protein
MAMLRITLIVVFLGLTIGCSKPKPPLHPQILLVDKWVQQVCRCILVKENGVISHRGRRDEQQRCLRQKAKPKYRLIKWDQVDEVTAFAMNAIKGVAEGCIDKMAE